MKSPLQTLKYIDSFLALLLGMFNAFLLFSLMLSPTLPWLSVIIVLSTLNSIVLSEVRYKYGFERGVQTKQLEAFATGYQKGLTDINHAIIEKPESTQ